MKIKTSHIAKIEDFTENKYKQLLDVASAKFQFISYSSAKNSAAYSILWRHDVDISPQRALALAKIEYEKKIKATYFFQLGSIGYNIFEDTICAIMKEILVLGHAVGLHFDPSPYSINTRTDLEDALTFEKNILTKITGILPEVFSFHNPTPEILRYDEDGYAGMINTYSQTLKNGFSYCSDSNGYWRYRPLEDFLIDPSITNAQVLTHPEWWQEMSMPPRDRVRRSLIGRAEALLKKYDLSLEMAGRLNLRK